MLCQFLASERFQPHCLKEALVTWPLNGSGLLFELKWLFEGGDFFKFCSLEVVPHIFCFIIPLSQNIITWNKLKMGFFKCSKFDSLINFKTLNHHWSVMRGQWSWGREGQIWLFSFCGSLEPSNYWTFPESLLRGIMLINFKPLKSTILLLSLIAPAGSTSRSL